MEISQIRPQFFYCLEALLWDQLVRRSHILPLGYLRGKSQCYPHINYFIINEVHAFGGWIMLNLIKQWETHIQSNKTSVKLHYLYLYYNRFIEHGTYICNVQLKSSKKAGSSNSLVFSSLSRKNNIKVFVSYRASSKTQTDQSHLPT